KDSKLTIQDTKDNKSLIRANFYRPLCAYLNPRNIFESGAKRHFQKYFCTTLQPIEAVVW
ncbi:MAG: hypothetical protein ACK53E_26600, partial [Pseudanabaena sp.]